MSETIIAGMSKKTYGELGGPTAQTFEPVVFSDRSQ